MHTLKRNEYWGFLAILGISLGLIGVAFYTNINNIFLDWLLPINTSLWEFGKLMFTSIILYSIIAYFVYGKEYDNYFFAKAATLFLAPMIFIFGSYLVDVIIGTVYMNTHIIMFVAAVSLGQYFSYSLMREGFYFKLMNAYAVLGTVVMLVILLSLIYDAVEIQGAIYKPMEEYQQYHIFRR